MKMEKVSAEFSAEYVRDGKALVLYQAGESRYDPLKGIDFMLCHLDSVDRAISSFTPKPTRCRVTNPTHGTNSARMTS
nr:MAG TPA: hypothetical protein [Ackermannviridae sp.]